MQRKTAIRKFPTWKTITTSNYMEEFYDLLYATRKNEPWNERTIDYNPWLIALEKSGVKVGDWHKALEAVRIVEAPGTIELVKVSGRELGITDAYVTLWEIHDAAARHGLGVVDGQVGPRLRLQYLDQPLGEDLLIGMYPVRDTDNELIHVFHLTRRETELWISTLYCLREERRWSSSWQWVFTPRK